MNTLPIEIMKIGVTPSQFDPKYSGKVKRLRRPELGLSDSEDSCVMVAFKSPVDTDMFNVTGLTISELKTVGKNLNVTIGDTQYMCVWNDEYKDSNENFFKELEKMNELD